MRVARAGARELNREQWREKVDDAIAGVAQQHRDMYFDPSADYASRKLVRHVVIRAGEVVLDAQMVIDLERALAEAEQATEELRELCDVEFNASRIRRMLDDATLRVMRALSGRGES